MGLDTVDSPGWPPLCPKETEEGYLTAQDLRFY